MTTYSEMAEEWTTCTMCRALTTGQDVLERAKDRAVEWPKPLSQPPNNVSFRTRSRATYCRLSVK